MKPTLVWVNHTMIKSKGLNQLQIIITAPNHRSFLCTNNMSALTTTDHLRRVSLGTSPDRILTTKDSPYNSEGSVSDGSIRLDILGKGRRGGGLMSVLRMVVGLSGGQDGLLMTRGTRSGHHWHGHWQPVSARAHDSHDNGHRSPPVLGIGGAVWREGRQKALPENKILQSWGVGGNEMFKIQLWLCIRWGMIWQEF